MVESVAEMAGKRKSFGSPGSPNKPLKKIKTEPVTPNKLLKKIKTEPVTPNKAKNQKNTPKKPTPVKANQQQPKKKNTNASPASQSSNSNSGENAPVRKTFSKRKFRDFVKDAATGEVQPEEALNKIQEQIKKIQTNDDLSNTAKRKLSKLYSIADKIQKETGINKIDISKQKSLKPVGKIVPQIKIEKPNLTKPIQQNDAHIKNEDSIEGDQSEEESEELDEEDEDDSEDGEEEEEGEEDSDEDEEVDSAEEESEENDDDEDDDDEADDDEEIKEEQTVKTKKEKIKTEKPSEKIAGDFVVFVGNIPFDTTEDEVKQHFAKVEILSLLIPRLRKDNRSRGFAIINVKDKESFDKALSLHFSQIKGRQIYVREFHQTPKGGKNNKQFGNQGKQKFNPNNKGPKQGGGFKPQNRRPMQKGGFKPKPQFQNKKGNVNK